MPAIRKFHGSIYGAQLHEVTTEEYDAIVAQYRDLKQRAEAAAASPEQAPSADLRAPRQAYELAYQLQRPDEEADGLQRIIDVCENVLHERELKAEQKRRGVDRAVQGVIRATEAIASTIATLREAPSPDDLPPVVQREPIDPASLVGADLDRARIIPSMNHESNLKQANRLQTCLDNLKLVPADARKKAAPLVEALLARNAQADVVDVADLEAIAKEQARRDEEAAHKAQIQAEAERLPETIIEMRELIAELQSKIS